MVGAASCGEPSDRLASDVAAQPVIDAGETLSVSATLAAYADSILQLERQAAGWAFADSLGDGEGHEDLLYTMYHSSIVAANRAVELDSANAYAWIVLSDALSKRAYRGFGTFDSLDLANARVALTRAAQLRPESVALQTRIDDLSGQLKPQ